MRRLLEPLAANYGYAAFSAFVTLLLVPLYVRLLGGAWGQLALCLTLQGFLLLADGTLSPLALRDAARTPSANAWAQYRRLLRRYVIVALACMLVGELLLGHAWAGVDAGLRLALHIALLQFGWQFANGAAIAFLIGRGRAREANRRLVAFALAKHALALALLARAPTAATYLGAFAAIGAVEFFANYVSLRREHGAATGAAAPAAESGARTALFVGASALGLVAGQLDRVVLALTQPAQRYGVYYLAGSVLLSLLSLQVPATRTFLPLIAAGGRPRAAADSMLGVLATTIVAPAVLIALFPYDVLALWLRDAAIASEGAPVLRLLMLAAIMNALYAPAGLLLVHAHRYATLALVNASMLAAQAAVLYLLVPHAGILSGAIAWVVGGAIQFLVAIAVWRGGIAPDDETAMRHDGETH
ncbi:MAG: lipopolysaccharide biosynthesis protein [Dokdonella sp.]|uniref:lipopolysaccharide biosynthesis protein n=1 Tax=Dokdonella sp. TaxID=2291710 RepID=UPI003F820E98